ncbi:Ubiquinol oxidase 2, mitochondrial [Capsicum baccatum]|uniref:Ubiquinol oxidase n=1 Tax=Capsicum baccatum TaxID=33114 RepID=A0A2G2XQW6_CAPBA|nr:Ubiquinol oxidase 2, mitochondrial [Capsicum baccatum]
MLMKLTIRDVNHFASSWETYQAELLIDLSKYHVPKKFLDKVAYWSVKLLRIPIYLFFKERYGCRAMILETVAGVPGMVGGTGDLKFELIKASLKLMVMLTTHRNPDSPSREPSLMVPNCYFVVKG